MAMDGAELYIIIISSINTRPSSCILYKKLDKWTRVRAVVQSARVSAYEWRRQGNFGGVVADVGSVI